MTNDSTSNGGTMTNISRPVIIAATVVIVAVIGAQVAITIAGKDSTSIGDLLQQIGTIVAAIAGAGSLAAASSAARSAASADRQTNGSLDARLAAAAHQANATQFDALTDAMDELIRRHLAAAALPDAGTPSGGPS